MKWFTWDGPLWAAMLYFCPLAFLAGALIAAIAELFR
jgi:hypothetical protein